MRRRDGVSGMTLMELVVVMGLIAVLLIGTIPRLMRSEKEADTAQAVRRLGGWISRLREEAVRDGSIYVLSVDLDNRRAWIGRPKSDTSAAFSGVLSKQQRENSPEPVLYISNEISRMTLRFLHDDPVDSGTHEIRFYPQGYGSAAALWLETRNGSGVCLSIEPFLEEPKLTTREVCERSESFRQTETSPKK
ncbi:pilus assembly FimT family protein [Desulfatirhabdium butyrativorans]|uniref:pilus assembly FimT family protein n=1 Tax=Desulfatirhabdium butyrativorans TaxID=340467 RepID=UPI0003FCD632|nr:hypothetical protein [Desulfatirhabdium butyrativorans]